MFGQASRCEWHRWGLLVLVGFAVECRGGEFLGRLG